MEQKQIIYKTNFDNWQQHKTILRGYRRKGAANYDVEYDFTDNEVVPLYDYLHMKIDYAYGVTDNGQIICFKNKIPYVTAQKENGEENGYLFSNLALSYSDKKRDNVKVHRAVAFSFYYAKSNKVYEYGGFSFNNISQADELQQWEVDHRSWNRHDNRAKNFTIMPKNLNILLREYDGIIKGGKSISKAYSEDNYKNNTVDELLHKEFEWKLLTMMCELYPDGGYEYIYTSSVMAGDGTMKHNIQHYDLDEKLPDKEQFGRYGYESWIIKHTAQEGRIFLGKEEEQDKEWYPSLIGDPEFRRFQMYMEILCNEECISGDNFIEDLLGLNIFTLKKMIKDNDFVTDDGRKWNKELVLSLSRELEMLMKEQKNKKYSAEEFGDKVDSIRYKYIDMGILK